MKLYAVIHGVDYEGNDLVGIYSTKEQADVIVELFKKEYPYEDHYAYTKEITLDELTDVGKYQLC